MIRDAAPRPAAVCGDLTRSSSRQCRRDRRAGFTLIELMMVAAIIGTLTGLAIPNFQRVVERARVISAVGDITTIGQNLVEYAILNDTYPSSLAAIGMAGLLDPWGHPYEYLPVAGTPVGQLRKDRFLVPINSDFDLYSMGPDGASVAPLTAGESRDDIVRANDGGFVGIAADY